MQTRRLVPLAVALTAALTAVPEAAAAPEDTQLSLAGDEFSVTEGNQAQITVRRAGEETTEVGVDVVASPDSATSPDDFDAETVHVTFAPGALEATALFDVVADGEPEDEESFTVTLANPSNAVLTDPQTAIVHIVDGDAPTCPPPTGQRFTDVDPASVHAPNIDCVAARGIANGTSSSTFSPGNPVGRGQVASFLRRLADVAGAVVEPGPDAFDDDNGSVHEANINAMANAGVLNGTGPRQYSPSGQVSRAQMAAFMVRTYEYVHGSPLPPGPDAFDDDNGTTLEPEINAAAAAGLAQGTGTRQFSPNATLRRDQAATFLVRLLHQLDT